MRPGTTEEIGTPFCQVHGPDCHIETDGNVTEVLIVDEDEPRTWMCFDAAEEIVDIVSKQRFED